MLLLTNIFSQFEKSNHSKLGFMYFAIK